MLYNSSDLEDVFFVCLFSLGLQVEVILEVFRHRKLKNASKEQSKDQKALPYGNPAQLSQLAGDLTAAVGDVVMLVLNMRHPSWLDLHLEGGQMRLSNTSKQAVILLLVCQYFRMEFTFKYVEYSTNLQVCNTPLPPVGKR